MGLALGLFAYKNLPAKWTPLQTIGLFLVAVGFILWTLARFQLGNSLTVSAQAKQLVTHGLYSKIRNPIYVFGVDSDCRVYSSDGTSSVAPGFCWSSFRCSSGALAKSLRCLRRSLGKLIARIVRRRGFDGASLRG